MTGSVWGPLSRPPHDQVSDPDTPWRDNVYVSFWDVANRVFGAFHVSTSPNAEGRRARLSIVAGGDAGELIEPVGRATFSSDSIGFDMEGSLSVRSPALDADLTFLPHLALVDYTDDDVIPPLADKEPLHHYQQFVTVSGSCRIGDQRAEIGGHGFRDRTWGYRDESAAMKEYVGTHAVFDDYAVMTLACLSPKGAVSKGGYRVSASTVERVTDLSITRDASGLFLATELEIGDGGGSVELHATERAAGIWVPMGTARSGPTMSAHDEFLAYEDDRGGSGAGFVEQGIVRELF